MTSPKVEKLLQELLKRNSTCADCGAKEITHASYNIGVFLCGTCAGIHNTMGSHISKVKHVTLDYWEESQVERLKQIGNSAAKTIYEQNVPNWMSRPDASNLLLMQHWIYSKYVRKEFFSDPKSGRLDFSSPSGLPSYLTGVLDSFLMKKMREDSRYLPRRFILENNTLCYFVENKSPKAVIKLEDLNASLNPKKLGKEFSLQLDHLSGGSTRHLYVYHDDSNVIVQWYYAILAGKAAKGESNEPIQMEGWLWKAGPSPSYAHRRRWFTLAGRKLMYHVDALDAFPKGEVFLGASPDFRVLSGGFGDDKDTCGGSRWVFTLNTPNRTFILSAETQNEKDEWIEKIGSVLSRDLSSKDQSLSDSLVRKRNGKIISILK